MGTVGSRKSGGLLEVNVGHGEAPLRVRVRTPRAQSADAVVCHRLDGSRATLQLTAEERRCIHEEFLTARGQEISGDSSAERSRETLSRAQFVSALLSLRQRVNLMIPSVSTKWFCERYFFVFARESEEISKDAFIEAIALLRYGTPMEHQLIAFQVFDIGGTGFITRPEFRANCIKLLGDGEGVELKRSLAVIDHLEESAFENCSDPQKMSLSEFAAWVRSEPRLSVSLHDEAGKLVHAEVSVRRELLGPPQAAPEPLREEFSGELYVQWGRHDPQRATALVQRGALEWTLCHHSAHLEDVGRVPLEQGVCWEERDRLYYPEHPAEAVVLGFHKVDGQVAPPLRCLVVQSPQQRLSLYAPREQLPALRRALVHNGARLLEVNNSLDSD